MKILKWVLILVGIVLASYGLYTLFFEDTIVQNQVIGMVGVGLLTVLAGLAIKNRS